AFKDDDWNRFVRISVGGTWNAQPITIAGGVAMMRIIDEERGSIYPRLYSIGRRLTGSFNDRAEDLGVAAIASGLPPENPTLFSVTPLKEPIPPEKMHLWREGAREMEDYATMESFSAGARATYVNYLATANSGVYPFPRGSYILCTKYSEEDLERTEAAFELSLRSLIRNDAVGRI
ncbi:hypothetical protein AC482_04575, partial [miscellaneous Crenarchaeota group-15 archaeon DG-45]